MDDFMMGGLIMFLMLIALVFLLVWSIKYINKSSKELHDKTSDYRKQADGKPFCLIVVVRSYPPTTEDFLW